MFDEGQGISPETRLWKAVVVLFFHDLQADMFRYRVALNGSRGLYWERVQAHLKLAKSESFSFVCDMSGLDQSRVINVMKQIVYKGKVIHIPRFESNFGRQRNKERFR